MFPKFIVPVVNDPMKVPEGPEDDNLGSSVFRLFTYLDWARTLDPG